jgi:predicted DCC family thiol-disulfide oxidoreductase YuxK
VAATRKPGGVWSVEHEWLDTARTCNLVSRLVGRPPAAEPGRETANTTLRRTVMSSRSDGEKEGWVLYDASCGICARWVPFWAPTLARLRLGVAALQEPWVAGQTGLSPDATLWDIRLLLADGSQIIGADVYRYVMRRLWWATPFYVCSVIPGARDIFDASYRAFAARRHRLSTACGISGHPSP